MFTQGGKILESKHSYIYNTIQKYVGARLRQLVYNISLQNCKPLIIKILMEQEENIVNHCVFVIYYTIFRENSPKNSIRSYLGTPLREDAQYDNAIYTYRKYRTAKDAESKAFFGEDFPAIYKLFSKQRGKKVDSINGQQLSESTFFELSLQMKYNIFDIFFWGRIQSTKKCSNSNFEDNIFPQIDDIYSEIAGAFKNSKFPCFMRSVEYYALEVAYHFEKAYRIAEKLKHLKVKKDIRDTEKNILHHIDIFYDDEHRYCNNLVCGYDVILNLYNFPEVDANDIYDIIHACCYIINKTVNGFIDDNPDYINWSISQETEDFCKNFFGEGQHIVQKNITNIRTKDFRDFYN